MLLNCHTRYSFCYGTLSAEELFTQAKEVGYTAVALTDINNTSACIDAVRLAEQVKIKCALGIDFRNGIQQQYIGIAINNEGFRELNEHLSAHLHSTSNFDAIAPSFNNAFVVYPYKSYKGWILRENEFIGISIKELNSLSFITNKQKINKYVALQTVSFSNKLQFNAHRLLRAIDKNMLLSKLPITEQANMNETLISKKELNAAYADYPEILSNTEHLLNSTNIHFEYGKLSNKNLKHFSSSVADDIQLLHDQCSKGLQYRYPNPSEEVMNRMEKELQVITQLNFASYFLINWDIINYAKHKNYYYVGRGSGANSIVAYLLQITDVDPIELDLYFERFINIHRNNAPDFDMDFSWTDRDDITRYIFKKHGPKRTALLGAYNTFQHDAVIRELGKVFGLPDKEIDKLQNKPTYSDVDELGKLVLRYSQLIQGFPSHLSIHSSGIIISELPIINYCATYMPPKGYPTTQFSMLEAEDIGLYKFDTLSQRGLGKIKDSLEIIKKNKNVAIDIHQMNEFKNDEKIKELLRHGKTIGCFYVESPAMRMLLTKLRADDYLRLVAASSIIRPGVAKSGMMREYILRYRNVHLREKAKKEIPELYDILSETYGVMVYQEDVIKVAHLFADLTLAEADYLRRGMSWKFKQRNEFSLVREKFFANCRKKKYAESLILDIWTQIESFANFAFSKGHSASYAVESYQAMYLKAYYPLEYIVATLNNGGGFYRKELYVHEARMNGAAIIAPCINTSDALCVIKENKIYLGLAMINELEEQVIAATIKEREQNGLFLSLQNFVQRMPLSVEQMRLLIRAGTFAFTNKNKKELLWEIHSLIHPVKNRRRENKLFEVENKNYELPILTITPLDDAFDELELFGFSLCSPYDLLMEKTYPKVKATELRQHINKPIDIVGYLINIKKNSTSKGETMYFGTFIDYAGNWIDTVHFPPSVKQFPVTGPGCYMLSGKVTEEYDFISIEIHSMKHLSIVDRESIPNNQLAIT